MALEFFEEIRELRPGKTVFTYGARDQMRLVPPVGAALAQVPLLLFAREADSPAAAANCVVPIYRDVAAQRVAAGCGRRMKLVRHSESAATIRGR